jgi:hypothetical protein
MYSFRSDIHMDVTVNIVPSNNANFLEQGAAFIFRVEKSLLYTQNGGSSYGPKRW